MQVDRVLGCIIMKRVFYKSQPFIVLEQTFFLIDPMSQGLFDNHYLNLPTFGLEIPRNIYDFPQLSVGLQAFYFSSPEGI